MEARNRIDTLESAGYVPFLAAGESAVGEFQCAECRYGVTVQRELPLCPMCGGAAWEHGAWSPLRRARLSLQ